MKERVKIWTNEIEALKLDTIQISSNLDTPRGDTFGKMLKDKQERKLKDWEQSFEKLRKHMKKI